MRSMETSYESVSLTVNLVIRSTKLLLTPSQLDTLVEIAWQQI